MVSNTLLLHDQGPFYDIVNSYWLSLYGIGLVYGSQGPLLKKDAISLESKWGPIFYQHADEIYALKNITDCQKVVYELGGMVLNIAYERVKRLNDFSPAFELFRHLRNAASHENKFYFLDNEPRRGASWKGFIIDESLKGKKNPICGQQCLGEWFNSGDICCLLYDIEQVVLSRWLSESSGK